MMFDKGNRRYWIIWLVSSLGLIAALGFVLFEGEDKTLFMPGQLTDGHHQLAESCESCHTDGFGGGEVLQEACLKCHGDMRVKPMDSHPRTKFNDPRNADRLEQLNAVECVTCHVEHKPEITLRDGLTQPLDVCFHCHADIGEDRPSHKDMAFNTCKNSGCHSYHDNRALYTDFLVKHMDAPALNDRPKVPSKEFADVVEEILEYPRDDYPLQALTLADRDAPDSVPVNDAIDQEWLADEHAQAGVNCSGCHQPRNDQGEMSAWVEKPGPEGCVRCHKLEVETFGEGKHGMRLAAGLSPMTPQQARLPMRADAAHSELSCNSCHGGHDFDVQYAAAEACLSCHADEHSLAYEGSPHHTLWQAELSGEARKNTGVSCATCHMPRVEVDVNDWMSRRLVTHNQSATLSPNAKMIRPACLHCHGLPFSIDALADRALIERNFKGQPKVHVKSVDLARADQERYLRERAAARR